MPDRPAAATDARKPLLDPDAGPARDAYLAVMGRARGALEGTRVLRAWDRRAQAAPRGALAHLRTLLAVHQAEDLVTLDLPWWTYEAVDRVAGYLQGLGGRARVFEFGSGASTIWLARRCGVLHSVEHHAQWATRVRALLDEVEGLTAEVTLHVPDVPASADPVVASGAPSGAGLDFAGYVGTIEDGTAVGEEPFDLVLVDGRAREESFRRALRRTRPGGLVLLDDAQRERYQGVLVEAVAAGHRVEVTRGRTPCQPLPRRTALVTVRG